MDVCANVYGRCVDRRIRRVRMNELVGWWLVVSDGSIGWTTNKSFLEANGWSRCEDVILLSPLFRM